MIDSDDFENFTKHCISFSNEQSEALSSIPNKLDYWRSLANVSPNKAPGPDGLPVALYKSIWHILSDPLIHCFNEAIKEGELSPSQKESKICFNLKKNKDRTKIKSYRPLSLMNVDTKIFAGMLKAKVDKVLQLLISEAQVGFMAQKHIGDNSIVIQSL